MAVYQEKDKKKWTKDGRKWYFRVYYLDMYGDKKQKQSKLYFTKKETEEAEAQFLLKIKTQDEVDYNISFESLYKEWLQYKKALIKSTTYYRVKKALDKHILEYFKSFSLFSIKTNTLSLWKNEFAKKGLSLEYQNKIIAYFKEILQYAAINYDFSQKIIIKLQKYKIENSANKIIDAEWNFWTFDEYSEFIKTVDNYLDKLMYTFLYYTGLRLGEMIALTWNDINLDKKILKIKKNFTNKVEGKTYDILDPKTKNSIRTIDLDDELVKLLKLHYEQEKKIYGFNKNMFIFGNIKYIAPTTFANHLNKYIQKSGVKKITPHGFRHSHVSLLIHLGCDSRDVAERIGDTVEVVEKTYYHMFPEKKSNTVNALNKLKNQEK